MSFRCSGCGECCKHVDRGIERTKHIPELHFPYKWDETGRCEKLGEDNRCTVYDNRPLICNVEKIAEHFGLKQDTFYKENHKACNNLMDAAGVDSSFRIKY